MRSAEELRALVEEAEFSEAGPGEDEPEGAAEAGGVGPRQRRAADEREVVALRLFPDLEYDVAPGLPVADDAGHVPFEEDTGDGARTGIARARQVLAPVEEALRAEGFYAYGTLDDQNRWTVAVDDEAGRVDVRLGSDGFVLELRATSPGLYADVEHPFRRRRMERAARDTLPRIARGYLAPHQATEWDEVDQGIAVRLRYELPFTRADDVGPFVRAKLPELEQFLGFVETQVVS